MSEEEKPQEPTQGPRKPIECERCMLYPVVAISANSVPICGPCKQREDHGDDVEIKVPQEPK